MEIHDASTIMPTPIPTLLLCALCDKPFTKEPQYRRHTAYCRKSQGRKRLRSCRACNQAKIKCNSCAPCHQCIRKGVKCMFDQRQSLQRQDGASRVGSEAALATTVPDTVPVPVSATATSIDSELNLSDLGAEGLDYGLGNDDLLGRSGQIEVVGLGALPHLSQFQYSSSKDGPDSANSISLNGLSDENSFFTTSTAAITTPAEEDGSLTLFNNTFNNAVTNSIVTDINFQLDDYSYYYIGKELQLPTFSPVLPPNTIATATAGTSPSSEIVISGHFTKNYVKTGIQQAYATMIIDMIYAYPRMMTRRETLPPFVHAYSSVDDTEDGQNRLPEHLTNCMGIAQLFAVRSDDTHSFVWATIRAEMRGFRNRFRTFNKYDALSALQASLVYFIIRAVEDTPQEAKDDYEMLLVYGDVCKRAIELANGSCQAEDRSPNMRWKDWIFMESMQRVACVWFTLGLVFHIRTSRPCFVSDHFRELLLPCTKAEWEAKTESQWRKEHNNAAASTRSASSTTALRTLGDLIDAHRRLPGAQVSDRLCMWNAGIDHLGMVLNLAVRMV